MNTPSAAWAWALLHCDWGDLHSLCFSASIHSSLLVETMGQQDHGYFGEVTGSARVGLSKSRFLPPHDLIGVWGRDKFGGDSDMGTVGTKVHVDGNQTRITAPLRAFGEMRLVVVVRGITVLEERRPWSMEIS